ncbi:MAG: cupredoxin domain-containing protein [Planctomycetota bacterium]|jgi:plastocyanin
MRHKSLLWLLTVPLLVTILVTAACGKTPTITLPANEVTTTLNYAEVKMAAAGFGPQTITVPAKTTVTWVHVDNTEDSAWWWHSIVSDTGLFDSGSLFLGNTFSYTFIEPGTYGYHCDNHPYRAGIVIVE